MSNTIHDLGNGVKARVCPLCDTYIEISAFYKHVATEQNRLITDIIKKTQPLLREIDE